MVGNVQHAENLVQQGTSWKIILLKKKVASLKYSSWNLNFHALHLSHPRKSENLAPQQG
jgi:hypothetical protein